MMLVIVGRIRNARTVGMWGGVFSARSRELKGPMIE